MPIQNGFRYILPRFKMISPKERNGLKSILEMHLYFCVPDFSRYKLCYLDFIKINIFIWEDKKSPIWFWHNWVNVKTKQKPQIYYKCFTNFWWILKCFLLLLDKRIQPTVCRKLVCSSFVFFRKKFFLSFSMLYGVFLIAIRCKLYQVKRELIIYILFVTRYLKTKLFQIMVFLANNVL